MRSSKISVVDLNACNLNKSDQEISRSDYENIGSELCKTFAETGFAFAKNYGIKK